MPETNLVEFKATPDEDANLKDDPLASFDIRLGAIKRKHGKASPSEEVTRELRAAFREAKSHRDSIGVTGRLERQSRQHQMEHEPGDFEAIEDTGVDLYAPISATKFSQAHAQIYKVLENTLDIPLTIEPSPIPEIPESRREEARDRLLQKLLSQGIPFTEEGLADALKNAQAVKDELRIEIKQECQIAADGMERKIKDRMGDAGIADVLEDFISNLLPFCNGFITWEPTALVPSLGYEGDVVSVKYREQDHLKVVHPYDVYPMPDCSDTQDGTGVFIVDWLNMTELMQLEGVSGFQNVSTVIKKIKDGDVTHQWLTDIMATNSEREILEGRSTNQYDQNLLTGKRYPMAKYYGKLDCEMLKKAGVSKGLTDGVYEGEVWFIQDYVIFARINPHPLGRRPIYSESYKQNVGAFWGQSMYDLIWDSQRQANATLRELYAHIPAVVQPIIEASINRWALASKPARYEPGTIFYTYDEETGGGRQAIHVHEKASHISELISLFERALQEADERSMLPRYSYGGNAHASAQTLGGLSLMLQNQSNFFTRLIIRISNATIKSIAQDLYTDEMVNGTDKTIKCDAGAIIRGVEGLVKKEQNEARATEDLQAIVGYAGALGGAAVPLIHFTFRNYLAARGVEEHDIDKLLPDPQQMQQLVAAQQQAQGGGGQPTGAPVDTAPPPGATDNRSLPGAVQGQNIQ